MLRMHVWEKKWLNAVFLAAFNTLCLDVTHANPCECNGTVLESCKALVAVTTLQNCVSYPPS